MTATVTPLPLRSDTILGVCEALGQDFGFHPNWLRISLAGLLFFNPVAVFALYLGLGVIVAVSRYVAPDRRLPAVRSAHAEPALAVAAEVEREAEELSIAA